MPGVMLNSRKDAWTGQLIARFENEEFAYISGVKREVGSCVLSAGISASHAILASPVKAYGAGHYDEYGPSVALKRDGPAGNLRLYSRAEVALRDADSFRTQQLMTGWLVSHSHQFSEDSLIQEIYDDRFWLDRITVMGCLVYDPDTNEYYWDLARECTFNFLGYPDLIDSPLGPCFAPEFKFGWRQQWNGEDIAEPAKGQAFRRTRSWDADDAYKYLKLCHAFTASDPLPKYPVDLGTRRTPRYIQWPPAAANVFKKPRKMTADGGFTIDNMTVLEALEQIARKAGAYELYIRPAANFCSQIAFLNMNPDPAYALELHFQDYKNYTIAQCLANPNIVKEGFAVESGKKQFHNTCLVGDAPTMEMMISMWAGRFQEFIEWGLVPAWSAVDEFAFKHFVSTGGGNADLVDSQIAFDLACDIWPWVYAAYRIRSEFDPWVGTKWEGQITTGRIRFKPFLNTWLQGKIAAALEPLPPYEVPQ